MNIATIGTGKIVNQFLSAVQEIAGIQCVAMYSRKEETARTLAEKYNVEQIYTDLDQMLLQPDIDVIYVASPNSLHYGQTLRALQNGKHVICEKPFTSTAREAGILIDYAKEHQLMLFEAITTIHLPNYQLVKENLGHIGPIRLVQCNYSQYSSRYTSLLNGEITNVFNPKFSGGALADINIYNLHFVIDLFGSPESVAYTANKHDNGVDTSGVAVLKYPGFVAECTGSKDTQGLNFNLIQGENGYIFVEGGPNGCRKVKVVVNDREISLNAQTNDNLLYYELAAFKEIYDSGDIKRCHELLDHTRSVTEAFELARKDADITFDADLK